MKGIPVSQLIRQYSFSDSESFRAERPHDWLVWEPGAWRPPADDRSTIYVPLPPGGIFGKGNSEPLAYELIPPTEGHLAIGRAPSCEIAINDGTLSQTHLVLTRTGGVWKVRDAGSRNGTLLNRLKLHPGQDAELAPGAQIEAAAVNLAYYTPETMLERIKRGTRT
jgi:pSer/pThr/pTyr-binding forkhead associated (FHA) protein